MTKIAHSPKIYGKLKANLELDQVVFKPVFEKLAPINFKKSSLTEAVVLRADLRSFGKEQIHNNIVQDSRKEVKSLVQEVGYNQDKNIIEETWKTSENHFQVQEKVMKI